MSARPHHDTPSDPQEPSSAPRPELAALDGAGPQYQPDDIVAQKYRLTRKLGEGGMGAVWLARNMKLDVDVAIKLIRHELGTAEAAHRLLQEARAAARIGHRSIVRIFDFGETELDDPFIVMEVLTGESLRDVLERKGRLPAANAVRTLLPIASALVEAHASGVVHRDLKPENVMLVPDKSGGVLPKLVDFGIAKFRRADEAPDEAPSGGFVVGTPAYMAPEQAGGRDVVAEAADVWGLAVIVYEAITGRVPFEGSNYPALTFAIMTAEPTPVHDQLAGDADLWHILKDALAKFQAERPTMRAFGTALAEWAMARGIDSDIAGTSLAAHWLGDPRSNPFSVLPPPVTDDRLTPAEVAIPRPGGVPGALHAGRSAAATEVPPLPEPVRDDSPRAGRAGVWVAVAVALAAAVVFLVTRGGSSTPPSSPAATASAPASASAAPPVSAAPPDPVEPQASASAPPASAATAPSASPRWKRTPRRGRLPIAKQPNF